MSVQSSTVQTTPPGWSGAGAQEVLVNVAIQSPTPVQPPGTEAITQVLEWAAWAVSLACLLGVFAVAVQLALAHRRGEEGGAQMARLGWVLGAAVLGSAAGPLVTALGA